MVKQKTEIYHRQNNTPGNGKRGEYMNYSQIFLHDTANGIGCRVSLFVSGCTHHCKDCFNEIAWPFDYGQEFTEEVEEELIRAADHSYINGFTFLGGEPMEVVNQKALRPFIEKIRHKLPDKTIWIYSGYTWEELTDPQNSRCHGADTDAILAMTDILVDGRFVSELKDLTLRFRGSSNQRIIDVPASIRTGKAVISDQQKITG